MSTTFDLTALTAIQLVIVAAILFLAAVGALALVFAIVIGWWTGRKPAPRSEPVSVASAVRPEPDPIVVVEAAPREMLLPPAPIDLADAPISRQIPMRLPQYDSTSWKFVWAKPADPHATGSFPEIRLELEDDAVVPPKQLPGFEIGDVPARDRFAALTDAALVEAATKLPPKRSKRKAKADLDNNSVVVS